MKPYCDYPNEFTIDVYPVDRHVGWEEGFCEFAQEDIEKFMPELQENEFED